MPSNKLTEKILLYKLQSKEDPEAFAKLYDIYARRIYSFIYFKVSSVEEAEDITSEVFLKAWHYISEKKKIESFSGLLYRLARNSVVDLYRSRNKTKNILSLDDVELGIQIVGHERLSENFGQKLEKEKIVLALQKLKQEYREIITLRYVDELEMSEISQITGKGAIAMRVTLHRALKKLKDLLKEN
ncbi:MAG: RNA polymerase sigma factor [Patescibacteria group bacterium]